MTITNSSIRAKTNKAKGEVGEKIAEIALRNYGINMIEKFPIPWTVLRKGKNIISAFPRKGASCDFIGIWGRSGTKVLAEVKTKDILSLSDLDENEQERLATNEKFGGFSYVVWVQKHVVCIYRWQFMELKKGEPYKPGEQRGLKFSMNY